MKIVDGYGRVWTDNPAPPGAFNTVFDYRGRLVSYCLIGPARRWGACLHATIDAHYRCDVCMRALGAR